MFFCLFVCNVKWNMKQKGSKQRQVLVLKANGECIVVPRKFYAQKFETKPRTEHVILFFCGGGFRNTHELMMKFFTSVSLCKNYFCLQQ